jgi:exopolyphosphatase / guanosine-5'-triphosphate,3'-diphosphate pyrophosphatase
MSDFDDRQSQSDAAVIDVGSNSVRLVLYRIEGRAVWTSYNEKVLAGLGRDLASTGRLSPDGVASALTALRRFRALTDANRPRRVFAAATAAVRDAADGRMFCRRVKDETGFDLRILTGEQEARYAAMGVLDGDPGSHGLVGDLGGASLELIRLINGEPGNGVTLPLGPFSMGEAGPFDPARVKRAAARHIDPIARNLSADTLNAVGGAWRNFALLHMKIVGYPLAIVHQYSMNRREVLESARFIGQQSRGSLERMEGISRRRVEALPHAAIILETLVERLNIQTVVMSAYGLREGLLFEAMSLATRRKDPLIEGCAALGADRSAAEAFGSALESWIQPAFAKLSPADGRDTILRAAACRLAQLGARLHPDHRAELMFETVLRAPIPGMNHAERAFLACAIFARHTGSAALPHPSIVDRLLEPDRRQLARAVGSAIRLGCDLSGRSPELLAHTRLDFRTGAVILEAEEDWRGTLLGEQTVKRAVTLAALLDRELKIRATSPKTKSKLDVATG